MTYTKLEHKLDRLMDDLQNNDPDVHALAEESLMYLLQAEAERDRLRAALEGLFKECAMVHKHWGDGSNTREADAAIKEAQAALAAGEEGRA